MAFGIVKWFDAKKGWGFITPDGGGEDIFAHFSNIKTEGTEGAEGFKTLEDGEAVSYELKEGDKGFFATEIAKKTEE